MFRTRAYENIAIIVVLFVVFFELFVGLTIAQQQPSPDDLLAQCQGKLHALTRALEGATGSSGDVAIELRRLQQQLTQVTQERDTLKKDQETKALTSIIPEKPKD